MHHSNSACFVASPSSTGESAKCAFYLHNAAELNDPDRRFPLTAAHFARVNPNTGTAPIFRTRRDAELTTAIYSRLPVLVDRSSGQEVKTWPVKYSTMFHMTNDSPPVSARARSLTKRKELGPSAANRFDSPSGEWVPLYEGKMVQAFDHRAASIVVNPAKPTPAGANPKPTTREQHRNAEWLPDPQFWVLEKKQGFLVSPSSLASNT